MSEPKMGRRDFLQRSGIAVLGAAGIAGAQGGSDGVAVPNSAGTERPKLKAPAYACDCHHHIYDPARFPPSQPGSEPNSTLADYRLLQKRIGTTRDVIVTPRPYVTDNRVTLDAIAQQKGNARGVAVIHPTITDAELKELDRGGIRGIRFSLGTNPTTVAATSLDMIEPLGKRVEPLGWHLQINMEGDQIAANKDLWDRVPTQLVFDHMGRIPQPMGTQHPAFAVIRALLDKGRAWVKLSLTYDNTKDGPPAYADLTRMAQAYVKVGPERMVWGSNWPHPNEPKKPDDALLFDLLEVWAGSERMRHRILVENPEALYGFPKSA